MNLYQLIRIHWSTWACQVWYAVIGFIVIVLAMEAFHRSDDDDAGGSNLPLSAGE